MSTNTGADRSSENTEHKNHKSGDHATGKPIESKGDNARFKDQQDVQSRNVGRWSNHENQFTIVDHKNRKEHVDKRGFVAQADKAKEQQRAGDQQRETPNNSDHIRKESTPVLLATEFAPAAQRLFNSIDTDHDGKISRQELVKAVIDPKFKGQDAQVLAAMYEKFNEVAGGIPFVTPITQSSIAQFGKLATENGPLASAVNVAYTLEESGKHWLSKSDIQNALKDPKLSRVERQAYEYLSSNYDNIVHSQNSSDPAHGLAVDAFVNNNFKGDVKTVAETQGMLLRTAESQAAGMCDAPFSQRESLLDAIRHTDIRQGRSGDCKFDAALIAVAQTHPEVIAKMISENPHKPPQFQVKFPGADHAVLVDPPTEAELGLYNKGTPQGYWSTLLEKAYGKYLIDEGKLPLVGGSWTDIGGNITPEAAITLHGVDAIFGAEAMSNITGRPYSAFHFVPAGNESENQRIVEVMKNALARHEPITVGTQEFPSKNLPDGLVKGHAYAVLGYENGYFVLRNPWNKTLVKVSEHDFQSTYFVSADCPSEK